MNPVTTRGAGSRENRAKVQTSQDRSARCKGRARAWPYFCPWHARRPCTPSPCWTVPSPMPRSRQARAARSSAFRSISVSAIRAISRPPAAMSLRINVRPLEASRAASEIITRREALRAPGEQAGGDQIDRTRERCRIGAHARRAVSQAGLLQGRSGQRLRKRRYRDFAAQAVPHLQARYLAERPGGSGWTTTGAPRADGESMASRIEAAPLRRSHEALTDADRRAAARHGRSARGPEER